MLLVARARFFRRSVNALAAGAPSLSLESGMSVPNGVGLHALFVADDEWPPELRKALTGLLDEFEELQARVAASAAADDEAGLAAELDGASDRYLGMLARCLAEARANEASLAEHGLGAGEGGELVALLPEVMSIWTLCGVYLLRWAQDQNPSHCLPPTVAMHRRQ